jgi:hypothetical protein
MGDIFKTITKAMREIVRRINLPFGARSMVRGIKDTIGGQVPHVGVGIVEDILFHAKEGFFWAIFTVPHFAEFSEGFGDEAVAVGAFKAGVFFAVFASPAFVYLLRYKSPRQYWVLGRTGHRETWGLYRCNDRHMLCRV